MLTASTQFHLMFGAIQNFLAFFTLGAHRIRRMTEEIEKTKAHGYATSYRNLKHVCNFLRDCCTEQDFRCTYAIMGSVETFTLTNCALILVGIESSNLLLI